MNIQVATKVAERLTTQDLRRSRSFKKTPEMLETEGEYPSGQPKGYFDSFDKKNFEKSAVKNSL